MSQDTRDQSHASQPVLPRPDDVTPPAAFVSHADGQKPKDEHGHADGAHRVDLPPMSTGVVLLMGGAFVALLAGLFVVGYIPHSRREAAIHERAGQQQSGRPVVNVATVKHAPAQPAIELPGAARAFQSTALYPRASGYLRKLNVDIGDKVKAGDTLAEIETPELDAQLASARATLEQNRAAATRADSDLELGGTTLKRYQAFAETGGVTQQQLDEKRTAYEQAKSAQVGAGANVKSGEAEVQRLEALQGFQKVTAPFAGVITARGYDAGALLAGTNASKPLFQLDQIDTIRVFVDVPQAYAPQIRVGNKTMFVVRGNLGQPFEGLIARTAGAIDEATRTLRVEADFPNAEGRLLPGTYGTVRYDIGTAGQKPPLVVPTGALVFNSKGTQVVVVGDDNKASFKPVTVGRDYGTEIEIATGLNGTERVVADPGERIADGVEVEVAKPADQQPGGNAPAMAAGGAPASQPAPARGGGAVSDRSGPWRGRPARDDFTAATRPLFMSKQKSDRFATTNHHRRDARATKSRVALAASLATLAIVAGCHVDQKAEVATYRNVLDATAPAPTAPTWADDHPLALAEAMALANANNEQLARGGEDYVQAIIVKVRAVAAFLPTLTFQPSYSVIDAPGGVVPAGTTPGGGTSVVPGAGAGGVVTSGASGYRHFAGTSNILHRFEAPLTGSINLFRAGADVRNLRAAEANIEARRLLLLDLQASTLLSVSQSYYAVLRAERSVAVLGNSLALQEARLDDVTNQFKNGLATRLTVAQSKSQVEGTRATLIQAQGDVANARSTLALIIGVPKVDAPLMDDYRAPTKLAPRELFDAQAIRTRPDLAAAVALRDVARNSVAIAFAQYYPSVSLNISGFLYREYYNDASKWSAILSANLPLFSGGLIQADVRAAWSRLRQAALDESYTRRSILDQVHQSYQNFSTADLRLRALDDQVQAADEAVQQSRGAYAASLATNLDVLTAQDDLLNAQLQQTNAAFDRTVFFLDLLRSTGTLTGNGIATVTAPTTRATTLPAESGS